MRGEAGDDLRLPWGRVRDGSVRRHACAGTQCVNDYERTLEALKKPLGILPSTTS